MTSAIRIRDLSLSLGRAASRVDVLKSVSLDVNEGEALGLIGPSGSGKSTLLMTMAGLERADQGVIIVAGQNLSSLDEDALAEFRGQNIGIVFQSFHLIPTMTALENVAVPLELAGRKDAFARAEEELRSVGLYDRRNHYPSELSGGEQQRVAIARAFVNRPLVLLADEPTGNLDPETSRDIMDLLDRINRTGTTVLMATHDHHIVDSMRQRVVELSLGRLVRDEQRGVYGMDR